MVPDVVSEQVTSVLKIIEGEGDRSREEEGARGAGEASGKGRVSQITPPTGGCGAVFLC